MATSSADDFAFAALMFGLSQHVLNFLLNLPRAMFAIYIAGRSGPKQRRQVGTLPPAPTAPSPRASSPA